MSMSQRIETYLKTHAQAGSVTTVLRQLTGNDLLMFGETHVKLPVKARFFAETVRTARRSQLLQYHASEHFINDTATDGTEVDEFLRGKRAASALSSHLRVMVPILEAARESLPGFGLVFAGTKTHDQRDRRIHAHFSSSRALHVKAGRFASTAKGQFHLGADHAARIQHQGTEKTTCARLVAEGFKVHVMRVTVDKAGSATPSGGGLVIEAGESAGVQERGAAPDDEIDLVPILRTVAGGKAFFASLKEARSPFSEVLDAGGAVPFADRFDSILHLPG